MWILLVFSLWLLAGSLPEAEAGQVTPIWTCCPPGSFLAIEDARNTSQDNDGDWTDGEGQTSEVSSLIKDFWPYRSRNTMRMPRYPHTEIRHVSCVPDVNRLPEIQTYRSRAPTGTSRGGDGRVSRELEEDQIMSSRGARLPQCPGGVGQLATLVLGDERANGASSGHWRISPGGELGWEGREDDSNLDFCLTWESDPRVEFGPFCDSETEDCQRASGKKDRYGLALNFTSYKPAEMLEAVYCDPCKTKVLCQLLSRAVWPSLKKYAEARLVRRRGPGEQPRSNEFVLDLSHLIKKVGERPWMVPDFLTSRGFRWPSIDIELAAVFISFLHANGHLDVTADQVNVTKAEFVSGASPLSPVTLVKQIFLGLDIDGDNSVTMTEARPESLLRMSVLEDLVEMLFKLADVSGDGRLSAEDGPSFSLARLGLEEGNGLATTVHGLHLFLDRDRDDYIEFIEVKELLVHIYTFFNKGDLQSPISVERVLAGLQRLGVPSLITELLHHQISPYITFARAVLQTLVTSADRSGDGRKDYWRTGDGRMDWHELENFSDFQLALAVWPQMLEEAHRGGKERARERMGRRGPKALQDWHDLIGYFSSSSSLLQMFNSLLYHRL